MAVLPRPPPRHVRAAGEAIAIVDLDEPRSARAPRRVGGVPAVTGIVALGVIALAVVASGQATPPRSAPGVTLAMADPAIAVPARPSTAAPAPIPTGLGFGWWAYIDVPHELALPSGVTGVRLSAIPDSLLNDQPAARFRVPVLVRGTTGLGATDGPAVVAWSEHGLWYELSSTRLTLPQLIDLASALR